MRLAPPLLLLLLVAIWMVPARAEEGLHTDPVLVLEPGMHTASIRRLDVDAAGRFLITASDDKTVRVWAAADGALLRTLRLPAGPGDVGKAFAAAISPDGKLVAAGGWTAPLEIDEGVYLFDRASGRLLRRAGGLPEVVLHLAFSPDGTRLAATLGGKAGVRLIDPATGRVAAEDRGYRGDSYGAAFGRFGRLATTSYDGKVRLYGPDLEPIASVSAPGGKRPYGVAFSPGGAELAVGYTDTATVDVLDATTLKRLFVVGTGDAGAGNLAEVAWSTDGRALRAAGTWQAGGETRTRRWVGGGRGAHSDLPLTRNTVMGLRGLSGGRVAFAAVDPRLGVLGADGREAWAREPATVDYRDQQSVLVTSADGSRVAFVHARWDGTSRHWDFRPMTFSLAERRLAAGPPAPGLAMARIAAPGLAVEGWRNALEPTLNGKPLALDAYETSRSLAVAPDGQRFALGTEWALRLFGRDGREMWRQTAPSIVWAVNVTGDGRLVVAAYGDGTIRWHRLSDWAELLALYPHADRERWVLWTPRGHYAASPGGEDLIGWQVNKGWDEAPEFYTASRFRDRFHRPDVVALALEELDVGKALARADREAGGARMAEKPVAQSLPPVVRIVDPVDGASAEGGEVIVSFEAEAADPVRNVMVLVNGRLALRQPREGNASTSISGRLTVPVPAGDITLSLIAENAQGASDPATVRLTARGGAEPAAGPKPTLHLIAVGVSTYRSGNHLNLRFAAKDAKDLANRLLRERGGLYADVRPVLLSTDPDGSDEDEADRRSVLRTFRDVQRGIKPGDVVIVFLSGHGANEGGRYYFLPSDVETDSPDAIADTGVSQLELRDAFRRLFEAKAKVIALIDTCYSGDVVEGGKTLPADVDLVAQELAAAENGVVVLTSSTGREISMERADLQNGIFTSALLEALKGEADRRGNRDGYVSLSELRGYLPDRVAQLSGNRQHATARVPFEKDWEARIAVVR